jgi:hypothetical protein
MAFGSPGSDEAFASNAAIKHDSFLKDVSLNSAAAVPLEELAPVKRTRKIFPETWLWRTETVQYVIFCFRILLLVMVVYIFMFSGKKERIQSKKKDEEEKTSFS